MAVFRSSATRVAVPTGRASEDVAADRQTEVVAKGATDEKSADVTPESSALGGAFLLIVAGVLLGWLLTKAHKPGPFTPTPGVSIFAVFYAIAQAIERLQEPFIPWLGKTAPSDEGDAKNKLNQAKAKANRDRLVLAAVRDPLDDEKATAAAKAQRTVDQIRANLTVLVWAAVRFWLC